MGRARGRVYKGHKETFGVTDVFTIMIVIIVPWVLIYVKTWQRVHFGYMQLIICQSYLKKENFKNKSNSYA